MARKREIVETLKKDQLYEAQELIFSAFDAKTKTESKKLALKALLLSPDCSDAYVLLSDCTKDKVDALALLLSAVSAGERALGAKDFKEMHGSFWGFIETRPYMRALLQLGLLYEELGEYKHAICCYHKMLDLNPNDNQGVRDLLMPLLIINGKNQEAEALFLSYEKDRSASWLYSRVLLDLLKLDNGEAEIHLSTAVNRNKFVVEALVGKIKLPAQNFKAYAYGSKEEATEYLQYNLKAWKLVPDALKWLKSAYI